jgi:hypothetical protein
MEKLKEFFKFLEKVNEINGNKDPVLFITFFSDKNREYFRKEMFSFKTIDNLIKKIKEKEKKEIGSHLRFDYFNEIDIKKLSIEYTKKINFLFCDFDFKKDHPQENILKQFEYYLLKNQLNYHYKSKGRGGFHFLIPVNLEPTQENWGKCKQFLDNIRKEIKIEDTNLYDLKEKGINILDTNYNLRLPQTKNFKEKNPVTNELEKLELMYLEENIQKNSNFIKNIKIKEKQIEANLNIKNKVFTQNNKFFDNLLKNKKNWQHYLKDIKKDGLQRFLYFLGPLGDYLKEYPENKQEVAELLNLWGDKNRAAQLQGWLSKPTSDKITSIRKWIMKNDLNHLKELIPSENILSSFKIKDEELTKGDEGFNYEYDLDQNVLCIYNIKIKTEKNFDISLAKGIETHIMGSGPKKGHEYFFEIKLKVEPILKFRNFYKLKVEIYNQNILEKKEVISIKTKKEYLLEIDDFINEIELFIKEKLVSRTINELELGEYLINQVNILDILEVKNEVWSTNFGYNPKIKKHIIPNIEEIKDNQNCIKAEPIIVETSNTNKTYYNKKNPYSYNREIQFYTQKYDLKQIDEIKRIYEKIPRCSEELEAYKFSLAYNLANFFYPEFYETFCLATLNKKTRVGKSTALKMTGGELFQTEGLIGNNIIEIQDVDKIYAKIKNIFPDNRVKFIDEIPMNISNAFITLVKAKCNRQGAIQTISKGNTRGGNTININDYQFSISSNKFNLESFGDFQDKFINLDYSFSEKKEVKSNLTVSEFKHFREEKLKMFGKYIYEEIILNVDPKEVLEGMSEELSKVKFDNEREQNQFTFIKFGERLAQKVGVFNSFNISIEYFRDLVKNNTNQIYTESDKLRQVLEIFINSLAVDKRVLFLEVFKEIKRVKGDPMSYKHLKQSFREYVSLLENYGIYFCFASSKDRILVKKSPFLSKINTLYERMHREKLNLKFLKDLETLLCKLHSDVEISKGAYVFSPMRHSMIKKRGLFVPISIFVDTDDKDDDFEKIRDLFSKKDLWSLEELKGEEFNDLDSVLEIEKDKKLIFEPKKGIYRRCEE